MPQLQTSYYHQTIKETGPNSLLINDPIYGEVIVEEPVLIDLIKSPSMIRLSGVFQHGITALIGLTIPVNRLEHSVGAMLLVRRLGASIDEQAAALLHDVSHTALSHVVDYAFPGQGSFHEVHKNEFLDSSDIPAILTKHGYDWKIITHEELFPLLEQDSPHLCADRLDYGIRDSIAMGTLTIEEAREIVANLTAFPDAKNEKRIICVKDPVIARKLADAYMKTDEIAWSNPRHTTYYRLAADIIAKELKQGALQIRDLWSTDKVFWNLLKEKGDVELKEMIALCENANARVFQDDSDNATYRLSLKARTIDPDVVVENRVIPLSEMDQEFKEKRQAYIMMKKKVVGMSIRSQ